MQLGWRLGRCRWHAGGAMAHGHGRGMRRKFHIHNSLGMDIQRIALLTGAIAAQQALANCKSRLAPCDTASRDGRSRSLTLLTGNDLRSLSPATHRSLKAPAAACPHVPGRQPRCSASSRPRLPATLGEVRIHNLNLGEAMAVAIPSSRAAATNGAEKRRRPTNSIVHLRELPFGRNQDVEGEQQRSQYGEAQR